MAASGNNNRINIIGGEDRFMNDQIACWLLSRLSEIAVDLAAGKPHRMQCDFFHFRKIQMLNMVP